MRSIRLRQDQIDRLRQSKAPASSVLRTAVDRFRRGDIVIQNKGSTEPDTPVLPLRVYAFRTKPKGYSDAELRDILDAHLNNPMDFSDEIARLDKEIEFMITSIQRRGEYELS